MWHWQDMVGNCNISHAVWLHGHRNLASQLVFWSWKGGKLGLAVTVSKQQLKEGNRPDLPWHDRLIQFEDGELVQPQVHWTMRNHWSGLLWRPKVKACPGPLGPGSCGLHVQKATAMWTASGVNLLSLWTTCKIHIFWQAKQKTWRLSIRRIYQLILPFAGYPSQKSGHQKEVC